MLSFMRIVGVGRLGGVYHNTVTCSTAMAISGTGLVRSYRALSKSLDVVLLKNLDRRQAHQKSIRNEPVIFVIPPFRSQKARWYRKEQFHTYAELISGVRKLNPDFMYADLRIKSDCGDIKDERSFSALDPKKEYPLHVESLSQTFLRYFSLQKVEKYAEIFELPVDSRWADSLPAIDHRGASFNEHCDRAFISLTAQVDNYSQGWNARNDTLNASLISALWIHAGTMANEHIQKQSSAPLNYEEKLHYEYSTSIIGTRAHGALDRSICIGAFVLGLQQAKRVTMPGDKHIFSTLAQIVAAREQALRRYVGRYQRKGLTESQIKAVLDEFPSVGVTSTGTSWLFLQYQYDNKQQRWRATRSPYYQLDFSDPNRIKLRTAVEDLLLKLFGAALMQWQHHVAVEGKLQELSKKNV